MTDRWIQGYACAVATLQRLGGFPPNFWTTDVKELARSGGIDTLEACLKAGVDLYDIETLFGREDEST